MKKKMILALDDGGDNARNTTENAEVGRAAVAVQIGFADGLGCRS